MHKVFFPRAQRGVIAGLLFLAAAGGHAQESSTPSNADAKVTASPETVVVTGTFEAIPETEIDRSVSVLELNRADLYQSWVDALPYDPSLDLEQRAPNDIQGDLSIRGSSFGQTLILLNGLRMDDVQSGHHDMDLPLPSESVERIEVLRGAGSAFYGSDAMAGAVNVITATSGRSGFRVGAGVGNLGTNQQSASATLVRERVQEQLDFERDFSSGFRPDRDYRSATFFSRTGTDTKLGHSSLMLGYGDKPFGADQFYGPFNSWE